MSSSAGNARAAVREQRVLNGIEAQTAVVQAGAAFWRDLKQWAVRNRVLSVRELDAVGIAARMPELIPNERQCEAAMGALAKASSEGFQSSSSPW